MNIDPQITVDQALKWVDGNQSELARRLGIGRASVNEWVTTEREYLPPLQAHRYAAMVAEESNKNVA